MSNSLGNDGAKTPLPDPDENKEVQFVPTFHQYRMAYISDEDLHRNNQDQLAMELGVQGAEGYLLLTITPVASMPGYNLVVFARTGVKVPKLPPQGLQIPISPKLFGPNGGPVS